MSYRLLVTGNMLHCSAYNIYFHVPLGSVLDYSKGSQTLHFQHQQGIPNQLSANVPASLHAWPRCRHYACQAFYLAVTAQTWRTPSPQNWSQLDHTASVDGEGEGAVFLNENGSGFQLWPQHTAAWLSASERRVPLLCHLSRNVSCGSAAGVCVCDSVKSQ